MGTLTLSPSRRSRSPLSRRINHAILSRRWAIVTGQLLVAVAFFGSWQLIAGRGLIAMFLSPPRAALSQAVTLLKSPVVLRSIGGSLESWGLGIAIAIVVGVVLGLLSQLVSIVGFLLSPVLGFMNAIPYLLATSLFVFWLGYGNLPVVVLIALGLTFLVTATVEGALRDLQEQYVDWARSLGATLPQIARTVYLPAIAVWIVTVARNCVGFAIALSIVFSSIGGQNPVGIGRIAGSVGGLIVVSLIACCIDIPLRLLERRVGRYLPAR